MAKGGKQRMSSAGRGVPRKMSERKEQPSNSRREPDEKIQVAVRPGESDGLALARIQIGPELNAAHTVQKAMKRDFPDREYVHMVKALFDRCDQVAKGSTAPAEAALVSQASVLDAVFNDLMRLGYRNFDNFAVAERLMRLALKAQSQSRSTWETLSAIKNPPVVYARQANIAHGHQQVNNGVAEDVRTREATSQPSKLLEQNDGEQLDPGTPDAAGRSNTPLETVGAVNRPEDS